MSKICFLVAKFPNTYLPSLVQVRLLIEHPSASAIKMMRPSFMVNFLKRARGSGYDIKTSIHRNRSKSGTQNVVKKFLELISNMLQNKFARSVQE